MIHRNEAEFERETDGREDHAGESTAGFPFGIVRHVRVDGPPERNGVRNAVMKRTIESVPVLEDIKTGSGSLTGLFKNYTSTLRHLAAEGITTVVYNFMPVLDWVRTDMRHILPDGSECLRYDPVQFAAFELHALRRPGGRNPRPG